MITREICMMVGFSDTAQKITARDEISLEDSGGRYARTVVWQRRYVGEGWGGTIAYVNSVFGDGRKKIIPDYFLICPSKDGLTCFSLEVKKTRLDKVETDKIPDLLRGIAITAPTSANSQLPAKQRLQLF